MTQQPRGSEDLIAEAESIAGEILCGEKDSFGASRIILKLLKEHNAALLAVEKENGELKSERTKLYGVLKDLHETTCPYKPFATIPHHEEHEDVPACTCSNQKKTRYWAVQDFLHRGEITSLKAELEAARSESKRIVAIAGKELLAAQAQNERLVLALKHQLAKHHDYDPDACTGCEHADEALSASPSTHIHEAPTITGNPVDMVNLSIKNDELHEAIEVAIEALEKINQTHGMTEECAKKVSEIISETLSQLRKAVGK